MLHKHGASYSLPHAGDAGLSEPQLSQRSITRIRDRMARFMFLLVVGSKSPEPVSAPSDPYL